MPREKNRLADYFSRMTGTYTRFRLNDGSGPYTVDRLAINMCQANGEIYSYFECPWTEAVHTFTFTVNLWNQLLYTG